MLLDSGIGSFRVCRFKIHKNEIRYGFAVPLIIWNRFIYFCLSLKYNANINNMMCLLGKEQNRNAF